MVLAAVALIVTPFVQRYGPVEFIFNGRMIWNARISDPSHRVNEEDRAKLVDGLELFSTDPASSAAARRTPHVDVRRTLATRLRRPYAGRRRRPARHPRSSRKGTRAVAKGVTGPDGQKRIKNERNLLRARWPWVTGAFGVLLTGLWLAAVVVFPVNQAGTAVDCADGSLKIVGSTAFAPDHDHCGAQITDRRDGRTGGRPRRRPLPGLEPAPARRCRSGSSAGVASPARGARSSRPCSPGASQGERTSHSCETADRATRDDLPVTVQKLGGQFPDVSSASAGYPFWTIEYLYTKDSPETGTLLESLVRYLRTKTVYAELVEAGYTPCVTTDGQTYLLCQEK